MELWYSAGSAVSVRHAAWAVLAAATATMIACCWLIDFDRILRRTPDDAYYFFEIAENVAQGNGPTFDGVHLTSGFQPLWLLSLVPVFWICPNAPETAVRIGLTIQVAMLSAAGLLIISVLSRVFSWRVVLGVTVAYTFSVFVLAVNGMESAVLVLALAALFAYGYHAQVFVGDSSSMLKELGAGLLLGIVMLARLDTVFLGVAIVAFLVWPVLATKRRRRGVLARPLAILAGAALVVAPYLVYNYVMFGKCMPISGTLKSSFPHVCVSSSWQALRLCVGLPKIALLSAIVVFASGYLAWYCAAARSAARDARFYFHTSIAVLACSMMLHCLHTLCFMCSVWTWHFFPYFLFAAVAIAAPLEKFASTRMGGATYGWAVFGLAMAGLLGNYLRITATGSLPTWQTVSYQASCWVRAHTDPADLFALKDAGNFGFFSQRRVINLDGLVNNLDYQEALKARMLNAYFRENHVKYLVLHSTNEWLPRVFHNDYQSESVQYRSHLYGVLSDPISLQKCDEVYRATYWFPARDDLVIWNISSVVNAP